MKDGTIAGGVMQYRNLADIEKLQGNPRTIGEQSFERLCKSIKNNPDYFEAIPLILSNRTGRLVVIAGNQRYDAAMKLGMTSVPTFLIPGLTEAREKEIIIRDNVENGEWDYEKLAFGWDREFLIDLGVDMPLAYEGESQGWNPEKTFDDEVGDGIGELVGYGLQSFWKDIKNENCPAFQYKIELPFQDTQNLVRQKYSFTNMDEIQRVVKTYMREGDYFLENCVGWATFSSVAKYYGFSGVGVDIWDVSIKHCRQQLKKIPSSSTVEIIQADGMNLPFPDNKFDFVYCNPPFMDEEKYSGLDNDIATKDKKEFGLKFVRLMKENHRVLKPGNLCVITINDKREGGFLEPLQAKVIEWGYAAGFKLWDFVVAEVLSQKIRLRKKDYELRRTVKCHEYVIVFKKP